MKRLDDIVKGKKILLRPATEDDKRIIFEWLTNSDITSSCIGPHVFPDIPVVSWDTFCDNYKPYFFDGSQPKSGRCFIIMADGDPVGQINHDRIDYEADRTELDIWMSCEAHCGKGHGSDALRALCEELHRQYGIGKFVIRPSARNPRAVRAYEKAGFCRLELTPEEKIAQFGPGDYFDDIVLIKKNIQ